MNLSILRCLSIFLAFFFFGFYMYNYMPCSLKNFALGAGTFGDILNNYTSTSN